MFRKRKYTNTEIQKVDRKRKYNHTEIQKIQRNRIFTAAKKYTILHGPFAKTCEKYRCTHCWHSSIGARCALARSLLAGSLRTVCLAIYGNKNKTNKIIKAIIETLHQYFVREAKAVRPERSLPASLVAEQPWLSSRGPLCLAGAP